MTLRAVKDLLVGALIGVMSMMPGASGGTIAVIFGIYERLIADLADIRNKLLKDLRFIIPVGIGLVIGLLVCAIGIDALLKDWEVPMMFFFAALILFQIPDMYKLSNGEDDGKPTKLNILACIVGLACMVAFIFLGSSESDISLMELDAVDMILLFIVGLVIAVSKIVPGLSGAAVLLAIGLYTPLMGLLGDFSDMTVSLLMDKIAAIIPIGLGLLFGVLLLSKVVDHFMRNNRRSTYFCILGLTIGSIVTVLVQAFQSMDSSMIPASAVGIVAGIVFGYAVSKISGRYAEETINEGKEIVQD